MTDETKPEETKKPAAIDLLSEVAEKVKELSPTVRDRVRDARVEAVLSKRTDALGKALETRVAAEAELKKLLKHDVVTYGDDLKPSQPLYTEKRKKEIEEAQKKLGKLDKAINAALADKPDWGQLNK